VKLNKFIVHSVQKITKKIYYFQVKLKDLVGLVFKACWSQLSKRKYLYVKSILSILKQLWLTCL